MKSLPPGWRLAELEELQAPESGAITDGPFGSKLTSAHYSSSGARVIRLQNIGDGVYRDADAFIPEPYFESLRKHAVRPGDLLIASLGEDSPRACLAPPHLGPAIVKADCIRVRLADDVHPRWVMYAMQEPGLRKWAKGQLHGVGRPRLGLTTIRRLPVPLPPLPEQRRITKCWTTTSPASTPHPRVLTRHVGDRRFSSMQQYRGSSVKLRTWEAGRSYPWALSPPTSSDRSSTAHSVRTRRAATTRSAALESSDSRTSATGSFVKVMPSSAMSTTGHSPAMTYARET